MRRFLFVMSALLVAHVSAAASPDAAPAPAPAQSRSGVAVVDVDAAIAQSTAYKTAIQQMQVTYKGNIEDFQTRQKALQGELKQKAEALQTAAKAAGNAPTADQQQALQKQYAQLQQRQQEANGELQQLQQPVARARAYVIEQISDKLGEGFKNVMNKEKIDVLLKAGATEAYRPAADVTGAVVTELNTLVPAVGIVPPDGWQPGQSQQQAPQAAAPSAKPQTK